MSQSSTARYEEVLTFWFDKEPLWYAKDDEFDRLITKHFESDLQAALSGELDEWAEMARGRLAHREGNSLFRAARLVILTSCRSKRPLAHNHRQDSEALLFHAH